MQTEATVLANNFQHCWMLHVASVCTPCCMLLRVVGSCCTKFETGQTFSCEQTDATTPNIVGQQCWELLRLFACSLKFVPLSGQNQQLYLLYLYLDFEASNSRGCIAKFSRNRQGDCLCILIRAKPKYGKTVLIDISSDFMQTCPHPLKQHFSKPEQSSSPWQASTQMPVWSGLALEQNSGLLSAAGNFNIIFMLIFCYSVLAERFSSLSSSSLLLSLSLSIIFHEILIMQVLTIGVTLNKNKPASFAQ